MTTDYTMLVTGPLGDETKFWLEYYEQESLQHQYMNSIPKYMTDATSSNLCCLDPNPDLASMPRSALFARPHALHHTDPAWPFPAPSASAPTGKERRDGPGWTGMDGIEHGYY